MKKLLLAIQFWDGDKKQAMEVAKLIADLEPSMSSQADFLFVSRFDCEHDMDMVRYMSRKFTTFHFINRRRATGWPFGPNELWFGTMQHVFEMNEGKRMPEYKAVLTFEADAFPLCPNWIQILHAEWDRSRPAQIVGALQKYPAPHVNGNAMFSGERKFMHWIAREITGCAPSGGWDFLLAPQFKQRGWKDSPVFRSWWQTPTMTAETYEDLCKQRVCFLHGVKDDSVIRHVRAKYSLT